MVKGTTPSTTSCPKAVARQTRSPLFANTTETHFETSSSGSLYKLLAPTSLHITTHRQRSYPVARVWVSQSTTHFLSTDVSPTTRSLPLLQPSRTAMYLNPPPERAQDS